MKLGVDDMDLNEYIAMKKKRDDFYFLNVKVEEVQIQFNHLRLAYHRLYNTPFNEISKGLISWVIHYEESFEDSTQKHFGMSAKEFENTGLVYSRYKIR